jgi:hypothetical protein
VCEKLFAERASVCAQLFCVTCDALVMVMVGRVEFLMGIHSHKETLMANECSVWILFERALSQSAVWSIEHGNGKV